MYSEPAPAAPGDSAPADQSARVGMAIRPDDAVAETAMRDAVSLLDPEHAYVWLTGADVAGRPDEAKLCADVAYTGRPLVLPDARDDPHYARHPAVRAGVGSFAGEPLIGSDGTVLGALGIWATRPHNPSPDRLRALRLTARTLVDLLERQHATRNREREAAIDAATSRVLQLIVDGETLENVLDVVATAIQDASDGLLASIQLRTGDMLTNVASPDLPVDYVRAVDPLPIGPEAGSCGTAAYLGTTVIVSDIATDARWASKRDTALAHQLRACWSVPILDAAGAVLGTFALYSRTARHPTDDELADLSRWVNLAQLAIMRSRALGQLRRAATRDPLTGLSNRDAAMSQLADVLASGAGLTVLLLDLDEFTFINDSFSDDVGDQLLRVVGERIGRAIRPGDTVARLGSDEFLVICPDCAAPLGEELAGRVVAELHLPTTAAGSNLSLTASVGVADMPPGTRTNPENLVSKARLALSLAKRSGRSSVAVFTQRMQDDAIERQAVKSELVLALDQSRIACVYQPSVDLRTGVVRGLEALARWQSPTRGTVLPELFIPIAEQSGLIDALGRSVLRTACRQLAVWRHRGPAWADLTIWVNVSARQLLDDDFVTFVCGVLDTCALAPAQLGLEITESIGLPESSDALARLTRLHELGVRVAIDDFGTGYSSLARLKTLPTDLLKLDRSLLADFANPSQRAMLSAIMSLADAIGTPLLAEGIETAEQRDYLATHGCSFGQGYLWTRPLPADQVTTWVEAHAR